MKDSVISLVKKCFLFYILFDFFSLAVSFFLSTFLDTFSNIRVFDLSFYRLQPVHIQILFLLMGLYLIFIAAIRYFRLLLSFVNADKKKNDYIGEETEPEILQIKEKMFNKGIMFIVKCLICSIVFSSIVQFLGVFNRY